MSPLLPAVAVSVPVSLDPADQVVLGIQNDISPSPLAPVRRLPDGRPDCTVDPAVGPLLSSAFSNFFVCIAEEGGTCTRLRAILIRSTTDPTPFPTGTLYSCVYDVDPAATTGTSLPVTVLAPRAYNERLLFVPETHAENGSISVVAPSPTPIDTASATPPPTPTSTPSVTSTSAPTSTRTPSATPTSTSLTPSATPTPTETPAVEIHIAASAAPPGGATQIDVDLVDRTGLVAGPGFDLLVPEDLFASAEISCDIDPRLPLYGVTATALEDPGPVAGTRPVRFVVFPTQFPTLPIGGGAILHCRLPVRDEAPAGVVVLGVDRVYAADPEGLLIAGVIAVGPAVLIDPDLPVPSATAAPTSFPTATATRSRTPTPAPSRTPTATVEPTSAPTCAGDCDGDGSVGINELITAVAIGLDGLPPATCLASDPNADGTVTIGELIAAVNHALSGCCQLPATQQPSAISASAAARRRPGEARSGHRTTGSSGRSRRREPRGFRPPAAGAARRRPPASSFD